MILRETSNNNVQKFQNTISSVTKNLVLRHQKRNNKKTQIFLVGIENLKFLKKYNYFQCSPDNLIFLHSGNLYFRTFCGLFTN
jgi:capsule polysaccharide export protein KpsC/LpsZ